MSNKPIWGNFGPYQSKFGEKKEFFPEKRALLVLNIPIIYQQARNQKKLKTHSKEKCRADGQADRQTTVISSVV